MTRARPLLGTSVEIAAEGLPGPALDRALNAAFDVVERVHKLMSFHDPRSDLSRLNRLAAIEPVEVHPWTARVIACALALHRATGGLFDCVVGAELLHWDLLPDHGFARVQPGRASAVRFVSRNLIALLAPVALDLGGIAKGFAVDRAIAVLRRHGARAAVVNAGGDLRVFGPEAEPVHIRDPLNPAVVWPAGSLSDGAIATSSAAETIKIVRGTKVSPLVCAETREPLIDCNAYSVVAPTCAMADGLTKVLAQVKRIDIPCFKQFGATGIITVPVGTNRRTA